MKLGNWLRGGTRDPGDEGRSESRGARKRRGPKAADGEPEARKQGAGREAKKRGAEREARKPGAGRERRRAGRGDRRRRAGRRDAGTRRTPRRRRSPRVRLRAARGRAGSGAARLARALRPALVVLLAIAGTVAVIYLTIFSVLLRIAIAVIARVARPAGHALRRLALLLRRLSALLTPERALIAVVAGAAILLGLSQFADYRSLSIGTAAYDSVQTIAPPPETGRMPAGSAHAYAFVPLAALCLAALLVAVRTRRPGLCRVLAAIGAAAIVIALLFDRPQGLDAGATALSFDDVQAHLLGGFYAQIAAGLLLSCSSLLLARELRGARAFERQARTRRAPGRASAEGAGA